MDILISRYLRAPLWLRVVCAFAHNFGLYIAAHQVDSYLSKSEFKGSEQ